MAVKPKDLKWEEAALRMRLEFVKSLKEALQQEDESISAQMVQEYTSIIDDIIKEVAQEVHRAVKTGVDGLEDVRARQQAEALKREESQGHGTAGPAAAAPPPTLLGVQMAGSKGAVDMFGNHIAAVALDQVACPICRRHVASGRFAPHLEKCMGKGRQASRAAARRISDADRF